MNRRLFLQFPLIAGSLNSLAQNNLSDRPKKGFKVDAGKDRFNEEIHFLANRMQCKVSAKDTDGDVCIFYNTIAGGPFLHYHYSQDEWFFVLKGKFQFKIGEETFMAHEGDSIFGPRMIPHLLNIARNTWNRIAY